MTETQTPNPECGKCAGTGAIPPFMDACDCIAGFTAKVEATTEVFAKTAAEWTGGPLVLTPGMKVIGQPDGTVKITGGDVTFIDPKFAPTEVETLADEAESWDVLADEDEDAALATAAADIEADEAAIAADLVAETEWVAADYAAGLAAAGLADAEVVIPPAVAADYAKTSKDTFAALEAACEAISTPAGDEVGHLGPKPDYAAGYGEAGIYSDPSISYAPKKAVRAKLATTAQTTLLARLIAERDPSNYIVADAATATARGDLTAKNASSLIDALMRVGKLESVAAARKNVYDGVCKNCGGPVAANTGEIHKVDGRWTTVHATGKCLTAEAKAAFEADKVIEPGLYRLYEEGSDTDFAVYRVRKSRGSSRLYAEKVIGTHGGKVVFAYNGRAMAFLRASEKLTWKEARDFGCAVGACVACGRTLTDARSLVQGYGATCAGHYGWPTVSAKVAEAIIAGAITWEEAIGI